MRLTIISAAILGLFATVTNFVPLSVLPFALFLVGVALVPFSDRPWNAITLTAAIYLSLSLANLLLYDPGAIKSYDFFRRDGNFFITYSPLLLLPLLRANIDTKSILFSFLMFSTLINLPVFALAAAKGIGAFGSFFEARNAAGGFFMFTSAVALLYFLEAKNRLGAALLLLNLLYLLFTYSRGSLLGFAAGVLVLALFRAKRPGLIVMVLLLPIAAQVAILTYSYPLYIENRQIFAEVVAGTEQKEGNILLRVFENWPRAVYAFNHSPILGTGVGSLNDMPLEFASNSAVVQFNQQSVRTYNSAHAHHSFLHVLGEQGIVGLTAFLAMLLAIYRWLARQSENTAVRDILLVSFFSLIFASLSEHRLPSPSNAFPFFLCFLLYWSERHAGAQARSMATPAPATT